MPKELASAKVGLGRGPLLLSEIEEEHACAEERAHVPRHDMCSVAHIFERLGLIRARCVCGPRRRKETRQFVTATSALEMELMTPGASASACVTPRKRSRHCDSKAKAAIGGRRGPDALRHTIEQLQIRN